MGARGSVPRPSLPEYTGVEVATALEASAVARSDWVVFEAVRRRCMQDLAAFGTAV